MIFLGINQDRFDSGVTLTDGERVLFAANEERYTRRKCQGGLPGLALDAAWQHTGVRPTDVTGIAIAGIMTPPLPARALPALQRWLFREEHTAKPTLTNRLVDWLAFHTPLSHTGEDSALRHLSRSLLPGLTRFGLPRSLRGIPLHFVEHHRSHAAAACHLSGFESALCLTADGMGDGLSMTVSRWSGGRLERLWSAPSLDSLGLFYEVITEALGFIPNRHEGKITGLAASGDPSRVRVTPPFTLEDGVLRYHGPHGRRAVEWARAELVRRYTREDIAAWLQEMVEEKVVTIARAWLQRTGLEKLAAAGGLFANVRLNQRLHQLEGVDRLFVCPNMGDGGQSLGAICAEGGLRAQAVRHVFWGDAYGHDEIAACLRRQELPHERCPDLDDVIADRLAAGYLVARFDGAMEWGPRALGNRSVLARSEDPAVAERLNRRLDRSDFMPFAPAVLAEDAELFFAGVEHARHTAAFMTVCFDALPRTRREHAAVVHVDGTARAQLVDAEGNPAFHRLLSACKRRSGNSLLLNTSFNLHEEPIVRTPEEAIAAFRRARLDYLAIGPFLACREGLSRTSPPGTDEKARLAS